MKKITKKKKIVDMTDSTLEEDYKSFEDISNQIVKYLF